MCHNVHCRFSAFSAFVLVQLDTNYNIRIRHSSWASPSGLILLGGTDSKKTSEKIQEDGTSSFSFELKYRTREGSLYSHRQKSDLKWDLFGGTFAKANIMLTYLLQSCLCHQPGNHRHHHFRKTYRQNSDGVLWGWLRPGSPRTSRGENKPWLQLLREWGRNQGRLSLISVTVVLAMYFRHIW